MAARLIAAMLLASAAPALAQTGPAPLATDTTRPFTHANSGITLPERLADLQRTGAREYVAPQLDVLFTYKDAEREELSVYIYRVTSGVPAVWFEQAVRPISDRPAFQRMTDIDLPVAFALPGRSVASGMRAAWTVSDSAVRSTALALVPVGDWLVKFRYSSTTHEAASLVRRLDAMIAGLGWPATAADVPAAARIEDCATPLRIDGASKPAPQEGASMLGDALLASLTGTADRKPVAWCRDRTVKSPVPIYRPAGTDNSYLAALSDSGHAVWVRPGMSGLVAGNRKPSWAVSIVLAGETVNYAARDRLPPPAQLSEILKTKAVSRIATWGKREIKIDPSQMK
ncbi:hypothetical protein [Sphingomonas sp.]|uniref:hypothetical protein n=1 Tax=Sphingomonas sp. TaxID=28214 RepID=UPI002ED8CF5F